MARRISASVHPLIALVLVVLGTARLTRFITRDWLGEWTIVRPVKTWAAKHETRELEKRTRELERARQTSLREFDELVRGPARSSALAAEPSRPYVEDAFIELSDRGPRHARMVFAKKQGRESKKAKIARLEREKAELETTMAELAPAPTTPIPPYDAHDPFTWQAKVATGLDCPFCVGFWAGALVLLGELTLGRIPGLRAVWHFGLAALGLNYVTAHISSRID